MKVVGMMLFLVGFAGVLTAAPRITPEIDSGSAGTAVAWLSGTLLMLKSRSKQ
jgi:hypothetical protein